MTLQIQSTAALLEVDGVRCRLWRGKTEAGTSCVVYVYRIQVAESYQTEFESLCEQLPPYSDSIAQQIEDIFKPGPTGKFPGGKLSEDDDGELRIAIAADKELGRVIVNFGSPVKWLGFTPAEAENLGQMIIAKAKEATS